DHLFLVTASRARMWRPRDQAGGPWESWDGGKTWTRLLEGLAAKGEKPLANWTYGRVAALDPKTGLLFYGADGLGFFARPFVDPRSDDAKKRAKAARWIDVSPALPKARVTAFLALPAKGGDDLQLMMQVEGENDTRVLVRSTAERVLQAVEAALAGPAKDGQDQPAEPLWATLPDPGARLGSLDADPHVPGQFIGGDASGVHGVLIYGLPGARPPAKATGPAPGVQPAGPRPPEGLLGFSAGRDGAVRVWDLHAGKVLSSLKGQTEEVGAVALAPDESVVATGSADRTVRIWDASDGSQRGMIPAEHVGAAVNALVFSPDSKHLYVGMEQKWGILDWNLESKTARVLEGHTGAVLDLAISADGKRLVSASRDRTLRCWDLETGKPICRIHFGSDPLAVAISPHGTRIYGGGRGAAVKIFDAADGSPQGAAEIEQDYVTDLFPDPAGERLYVAGDRGVFVVKRRDLSLVEPPAAGRLEGPPGAVFSLAVTRDGRWIVAGGAENGLWMWARGEAKPYWFSTTAHAGAVLSVALTGDVGEGGAAPQPDDAGKDPGKDAGKESKVSKVFRAK
ncbi:MAG: WD40 repeat domain-containing protein, partial [Planctomycetota bacterium]